LEVLKTGLIARAHHLVFITVYNLSPHISILCSAARFGAAALSFGLASFRPRRLAAAQKLSLILAHFAL